jgi:hypothetical protein
VGVVGEEGGLEREAEQVEVADAASGGDSLDGDLLPVRVSGLSLRSLARGRQQPAAQVGSDVGSGQGPLEADHRDS